MLGHLQNISAELCAMVADKLGMADQIEIIQPAVPPNLNIQASPALSQYADAPLSVAGKKFGILVTNGSDAKLIGALLKKAKAEKATVEIVALKAGGIEDSEGQLRPADQSPRAEPSSN